MSLNPNGAPPGYYYQAGATAYLIDPAGTYSAAGASAPTTDPAGTYSAAGASAPTPAAAGTYIPVAGATSSAAEIVDPAGTYSAAGASAATTDPAGKYSAAGASAPKLAAAGTYIPVTGATSSAAEIVDSAGTYSAAGASAPKLAAAGTYIPVTRATSSAAEIVDPAGTYSAAGASAPTTDPAGTYSVAGASAPTLAAAGTYIPVTGATSSAAEVIDPAGMYSAAGASAPTTDPAGTYSAAGASAPTPADAGTYIPFTGATSSAAEIVDSAGTYSAAGASAPTTDPAGTYSAAGASAPTLAAAGTYIPVAGATSSAPEIVDPAGTYSAAGASAPTTDPAGTYSAAGASAPTLAAAGTYLPVAGATSSAPEIVDPAGTYSAAGASAPTTDPAGTYSAAGASAPTPADAGTYLPVVGATSSAPEIVDPAGTYSAAGASAPTTDPAGTYSAAAASAPMLAAAGTYIPVAGATSSAAEIVDPAGTSSAAGASAPTTDPAGTYSLADATAATADPAGTYSLAGASAPAADPAGTHSAAGASAPTTDPAGTYSTQFALDRLVLDPGNDLSPYRVASFNSATAVANYFGTSSLEAELAADYFTTYGSSANMIFVRYPIVGSRAHLFGADVIGMTLAQLQTINGTLSITSQGYGFSASINLKNVQSLAGAATAITNALDANLPVAAVTTGNSIAPVSVSFTGTLDSTGLLDVTSISSGSIEIGAEISGAGVPTTGAQIYSQETGTPGGVGVYNLYSAIGNISSAETMTETYGVLTVGSVSSGTVADGEEVTDKTGDVLSYTGIEDNLSGSGAGSTWLVNNAQTVASESMTMTAAPLQVGYLTVTGATENSAYYYVSQNGNFAFNSASLSYMGGTAAGALGLTQASGAYVSTPGEIVTNPAAWMNNFVQNESDQFGSFQTDWTQLAQLAPQTQSALEAWAQSTDGQFQFLQNYTGTTPPAGASKGTVDPAGTYSGAGASAPTPAAAGTYIPAAGATSTAAEIVDPAGSYSLAGASAPTLAQPGYYVSTAGASTETPDDPGYYTPNSGATAEILALPPVISGTSAGQSVDSGQSDTPFASVTIADPNIGTSDSLSIQLTGAGGTLADGAGFTGLMTSAPGVYTLSGSATAITSELDALVFTAGAGSGTTTITLTDGTSVGTSASDANTTLTILSTGTDVVSVATFLADQSTLDNTSGGFDISDTAANITANLDQLNDPNIDAIIVSDNGQVGASVQQLTTDAAAIGKLFNQNGAPCQLAISDTAADVTAGLNGLNGSNIASITISDDNAVGASVAQLTSDAAAISKLANQNGAPYQLAVTDTAADITAGLNSLNGSNIASITISDNGAIGVSVAELTSDATAISKLANQNGSSYQLAVTDSAADITAGLNGLNGSNIASITISDNGAIGVSVAELTSDAAAIAELANQNGTAYQLAVADTAADIAAGLNGLNGSNIASIAISDDNAVGVSVAQLTSDAAAISKLANQNGNPYQLAVTDTAADIAAGLNGLDGSNIASITISDNGAVGVSIAELTSDATAIGKLANASGTPYQLAISDTAANVQADLASLEADVAHIASITLTSGTVVVSISTFTADQGALNKIGGGFYISDSAANISASLNALNDANINTISVSDNGAVGVSVAELTSDATAISELANQNGTAYQLAVADTAADIAAGLNGLDGSNIASITISDNGAVGVSIAELTSDATAISELANQNGTAYQLAVVDTAADIAAGLNGLDGSNIASITISDNGAVGVSIAELTSDATAIGKLANASGTPYQLAISDTAANVQADLASSGGRSRAHRLGHFDEWNGRRLGIDVHRRSGRAQQDRRRVLHFGQCGEHIGEPQRAQRRQHRYDHDLRQWRGRRHGRSIVERRDGDRQARQRQRDALPARDFRHRGPCRGRLIDPQRRFARGLDHGDERQRDLERGRRRERAHLLGNGLGDEPHRRRGACLRRRLRSGGGFDDRDNGRKFAFADGNGELERDDERRRDAGDRGRQRYDQQRREGYRFRLVDLRFEHERDAGRGSDLRRRVQRGRGRYARVVGRQSPVDRRQRRVLRRNGGRFQHPLYRGNDGSLRADDRGNGRVGKHQHRQPKRRKRHAGR